MDYTTFVSQTIRLYPKFAANLITKLLLVNNAVVGTTFLFARISG
jgi:hypothetical protein